MVKKNVRTKVERTRFKNYVMVAENFYHGAEVAHAYEYWNASGVLIVHTAIALADAISIKLGGVKCHGENHHETLSLLDELISASKEKTKALHQLQNILDHKTLVSYSGEVYERKDVDMMWKLCNRFRDYALSILK